MGFHCIVEVAGTSKDLTGRELTLSVSSALAVCRQEVPEGQAIQTLPLTIVLILTLELPAWPTPPTPAPYLCLLPPHLSSQLLNELLVTGQGPVSSDSFLLGHLCETCRVEPVPPTFGSD